MARKDRADRSAPPRSAAKRPVLEALGLAARASRTALSERLSSLDLYPGQDAVLDVLTAEDGVSLRDLARRLGVRPPTVTKTIARLAAQGHVEKRPSPSDARQSHAFLTERGRDAAARIGALRKSVEREALADFKAKERKLLRRLLVRLAANLGAGETGGDLPDEAE